MKRIVGLVVFIIWLFWPFRVEATCPCQEGQVKLCLDQACQSQTINFSANQTVFFQVENEGDGSQQRLVRILDSQKQEVNRVVLDRSLGDPYLYSASFTAPGSPGTYYVDVKIEGGGSNFASQRNFTVIGSAGQVINFRAVTPTPTVYSPRLTPTAGVFRPQVTPTSALSKAGSLTEIGRRSIGELIKAWFQRIISFFNR